MVKAGFYGRTKIQRYKCQQCGKRFAKPQQKPFGANGRLPQEKVEMILHCLVEGNSVRSTARLCDVENRTVLNILKLAGENCERILAERIQNVPVRGLQLDEIWSCVQKKVAHKFPFEAHDDNRRCLHVHRAGAIQQAGGCMAPWTARPREHRRLHC
jgi:transposase-like protein